MKKLPIGIQTLSHIIQDGYVYVDKTAIAHRLITSGKYYFLSRPRRFGKSLFLDTLKEIFEGNKALFKGLFIEDQWDFSKKYPVIHLDFSVGLSKNTDELERNLRYSLQRAEPSMVPPLPMMPLTEAWSIWIKYCCG
ncbi:MAG: AAA family ATPase [Saprospiraceae bacterium]|nr:AAA family ATPase [Saprospiraceae bacterium]